jgi:Protein of unknown function (DUF1501)
MFSISDAVRARNCSGYTRREFLRVGGLGLGGLTLAGLLAAKARAGAGDASRLVKDKSVVFLFLQGGPPHIELFDPKMTAPEEIRSTTGEVQTVLPGITFGGTFPQLAKRANKIAIVRSFASNNGDHQNYLSVVGAGNPIGAPMGALYSRAVGSTNARTGIPSNILVKPEAVQAGLKMGQNFETDALKGLLSAGQLGATYGAFDPSGGGELKQDMELKLSRERFDDRRMLLAKLDSFKRQVESTGELDGADAFQQQAIDVVLRGVAEAFDLSKEDPKTLERYDTSKLFRMEDLTKWNDMRRSSNLLGKQMLLARRLCEAGCGFVTVTDAGWDMHSNENSPKKMGGLPMLGGQIDHAVSAFIDDLEERGLTYKILLVMSGEMGRTPKLNRDGGRDHYANLTSLLLAGGGLQMGQVIGRSDRNASNPATEKYTPKELMATVMNTIFDLGEVRISRDVPSNAVQVMTDGKPIPGLL